MINFGTATVLTAFIASTVATPLSSSFVKRSASVITTDQAVATGQAWDASPAAAQKASLASSSTAITTPVQNRIQAPVSAAIPDQASASASATTSVLSALPPMPAKSAPVEQRIEALEQRDASLVHALKTLDAQLRGVSAQVEHLVRWKKLIEQHALRAEQAPKKAPVPAPAVYRPVLPQTQQLQQQAAVGPSSSTPVPARGRKRKSTIAEPPADLSAAPDTTAGSPTKKAKTTADSSTDASRVNQPDRDVQSAFLELLRSEMGLSDRKWPPFPGHGVPEERWPRFDPTEQQLAAWETLPADKRPPRETVGTRKVRLDWNLPPTNPTIAGYLVRLRDRILADPDKHGIPNDPVRRNPDVALNAIKRSYFEVRRHGKQANALAKDSEPAAGTTSTVAAPASASATATASATNAAPATAETSAAGAAAQGDANGKGKGKEKADGTVATKRKYTKRAVKSDAAADASAASTSAAPAAGATGEKAAKDPEKERSRTVYNIRQRRVARRNVVAFGSVAQLMPNNVTAVRQAIESKYTTWTRDAVVAGAAVNSAGLIAQWKLAVSALFDYNVGATEFLFTTGFPTNDYGIELWPLLPFSRGYVHAVSADAFSNATVNPRYFSVPFDMDLQVASSRAARRILQGDAFKNISSGPENKPGFKVVPDDSVNHGSYATWQAWISKNFGSVAHPIATCSLAPRAMGGVVDPNFLVYGTTNVRVVDASTLPMQISAHLSSTLYGIAERAADSIKAAQT
ncbi:unnamed protein product [Tilletia controversa]|nr:unnamed protein product [Tilletia controversa]